MTGYAFAIGACVLLVVFLFSLLRTRRMREKYAILWIILALAVCVIGAFPGSVAALARVLGVQTPSNLLFALAIVVLLLVSIQLSTELTSSEEETRKLAEEIALLRFDVDRLAAERPGDAADDPGPQVP